MAPGPHNITGDPTYLLGLLEAMDSGTTVTWTDTYVGLQDYTHSSTDVHVQDETTNNQDISFRHSRFYSVTLPSLAFL